MKTQQKPNKIGILGGLGPLATNEFLSIFFKEYAAIHKPKRDQDFPEIAVVYKSKTPDRTAHILDSNKPNPTQSLQDGLSELEIQNCNLIIIPCNTAHFFVPYLQTKEGTVIVSILTAAANSCKNEGKKTPLLLATKGTIESGIYEKIFAKFDLKLTIPDQKSTEDVMEVIYGKNGVKAGFIDENNQQKLAEIAARFPNCDSVILGCTELPLVSQKIQNFTIDPMRAAARAAIALLQELNNSLSHSSSSESTTPATHPIASECARLESGNFTRSKL